MIGRDKTEEKMIEIPKKSNLKSDVRAKLAFKEALEREGKYDSVEITSSPADITAVKDGIKYYFEIKFTRQKNKYFGAATITEWKGAMDNPDNFWFVIAVEKEGKWHFIDYTPTEFMQFNNIPPFKTYFNIDISKGKAVFVEKKTKSIRLTKERIEKMRKFFD